MKNQLSAAVAGALTAVLLLALAVMGPGCGEKAQQPSAFDQATVAQLELAVHEAMDAGGIPGVIAGAWVPGRGEWVAAEGLADRETGEEIEVTDRMRIGSVTKSFTATLVLVLADEGLLGLDDTLAEYFPWVENAQNITVRMLLNHTSGIVDDYESPAFLEVASVDPLYDWEPEELVRASLGTFPEAVLGETCIYSNTNYVLLGMISEQVTGMELAGAMEEYVFGPLSLDNTVLPSGPEIAGEYSHSYMAVGEDGELYDMTSCIDPSITWAAGAIISTLEDVKIWAEALAAGELLEEATHEEQLQWVEMTGAEEAGIGYEYGLGILKLGDFIGHNGEFSGFLASMFYLPSQGATIVVLLNCNANPVAAQDLFMRIAAILFPDD